MDISAVALPVQRENLPFPLNCGVAESQIKTPPADGIAKSPFLIRCEDDERNRLGMNRPKLGNSQLPIAEDFQKQGLKFVINLIDLIDEQNARFLFVEQRSKQRAFCEEFQPMKFLANGFPRVAIATWPG